MGVYASRLVSDSVINAVETSLTIFPVARKIIVLLLERMDLRGGGKYNMHVSGFKIYESVFATQDGVEDRVTHTPLSFWQRVFNIDPYANFWTMTKEKIIRVSCRKPAIYRIADKLIVHPSLIHALLETFKK